MSRHLTISQKRILERILQSEHGATTAQIAFALYGAYGRDEPRRAVNTISVQLIKIRSVLALHGLSIATADRYAPGARYYVPIDVRPRARAFLAAEAHRLAEPIKGYEQQVMA